MSKGPANGDGTQPSEFFGIPLPSGTGAPGTDPSRTPAEFVPVGDGAESGLPNVGTIMPLNPVHAMAVNQPGQADGLSVMTGTTAEQVTQTGAGQGKALIDSALASVRDERGQQRADGG